MPVEGAGDALLAGHALIPLAAQRAAMPRAEPHREIDRGLLPLDLAPPLVGIGMREVRGETEHRRHLPGLIHHPHDRIDVLRLEAPEPAVVVLDPFPAERGRVANPLLEGSRAADELVEVALGEDGDAGAIGAFCHDRYGARARDSRLGRPVLGIQGARS